MAKKKVKAADSDIEESYDEKDTIQIARKSVVNNSNKKKKNTKKQTKKGNKVNAKGKNTNNSAKKGKPNNKKVKNEDDDEDSDILGLTAKVLPGQKYPTPPKGDPLRAFYESLLKVKPECEMALKHCIEYGCLNSNEAEAALAKYEKILKKKKK